MDQEHPSLVAAYTIDRGREYELDRTDVGRATVTINDPEGILDPTNPSSPYVAGFGLQPLLQAVIARRNPIDGVWYQRFRGFIEDFDYVIEPPVNRAVISLVDLFEIVGACELHPGMGDTPPTESKGQVFFLSTDDKAPEMPAHTGMQIRVRQILEAAGIDEDWEVTFSGSVALKKTVYSPGESALTAIQEAADSEFPSVSNVFCDRRGRICTHGRFSRFDPVGTSATVSDDVWDFRQWTAGDGAAVTAAPTTTAHIRAFAFNRGLSKIINKAFAAPVDISDTAANAQVVDDVSSQTQFGTRGWSSQYLLTARNVIDDSTALIETKRFAQYFVDSYKEPQNRITQITLRSIRPTQEGATPTWGMLSRCDIGDWVTVNVDHPGGGGFTDEKFFIEGIHETCSPLNPDYDDVGLTLDLSPDLYYPDDNPFPPLP